MAGKHIHNKTQVLNHQINYCNTLYVETNSIILLCNILLFITNITIVIVIKANKKKLTKTVGCQKYSQDISIIVNPDNNIDIITPNNI